MKTVAQEAAYVCPEVREFLSGLYEFIKDNDGHYVEFYIDTGGEEDVLFRISFPYTEESMSVH